MMDERQKRINSGLRKWVKQGVKNKMHTILDDVLDNLPPIMRAPGETDDEFKKRMQEFLNHETT